MVLITCKLQHPGFDPVPPPPKKEERKKKKGKGEGVSEVVGEGECFFFFCAAVQVISNPLGNNLNYLRALDKNHVIPQ